MDRVIRAKKEEDEINSSILRDASSICKKEIVKQEDAYEGRPSSCTEYHPHKGQGEEKTIEGKFLKDLPPEVLLECEAEAEKIFQEVKMTH